MKVLQIGTSLHDWGGIERYISYLADGLIERGHEVQIAAPPNSPLAQRRQSISIPQSLRLQFSYWRLPQFSKLMREGKYDAVHAHFSPDFVIPLLAARMAKVPRIVMTRHVAIRWSPAKVQRYVSKVHRIVCVSDAVQKVLLDSNVPADKLVVAKAGCPPLAAGPGMSELRKTMLAGGATFAVGFFGRLVSDKGVQFLAKAAEKLPESIAVHVFGEGPFRPVLESMGSRLRFHGFVPEIADAMGAVDCVAIPSIWAEPFPFAALEAMSLGKPIVASRRGGLPEMVQDGETGLLVEAEDANALAEAIERLAANPSFAAEMGSRGQAIQRETYTVAAFAERIERVYKEI